jgi:hypothetical protein
MHENHGGNSPNAYRDVTAQGISGWSLQVFVILYLMSKNKRLLGAFAKFAEFEKANICFCIYACPFAWKQLRFHWTDFHEI